MPGDWNLSWHHRSLGIGDLWDRGITGLGVTVALLDTGLSQPTGLDQAGFEYLDAFGNVAFPFDPIGHGTGCGSVIASYLGGALGIAPNAKLVSFRVVETGNAAADVESALIYILQNRPDIDIVSCSFTVEEASERLQLTIRQLANAGKVVVAAAGDIDGQKEGFPELTQNVITVAAVDSAERPLAGASVGPWIDVAAPGVDLPVLVPQVGQSGLFSQSSAAAAVTSGVVALALSTRTSGTERRMVGRALEGLLKATAVAVVNCDPQAVGAGIVNPSALIERVKGL
jgi:subtilisin family serine protease